MKDLEGFNSEAAWAMFSKSGNVGTYLLYEALKKDEIDENG